MLPLQWTFSPWVNITVLVSAISLVLNPKVITLFPFSPSDASWSSAMVTVTCNVDGIVVSGVTGGSEPPDEHALSTIGTNQRKSTMEYLIRVDRVIHLLTVKASIPMSSRIVFTGTPGVFRLEINAG